MVILTKKFTDDENNYAILTLSKGSVFGTEYLLESMKEGVNSVEITKALPIWKKSIVEGLFTLSNDESLKNLKAYIDNLIERVKDDDQLIDILRKYTASYNELHSDGKVVMKVVNLGSGLKRITFKGNPIKFKLL